MDLKTIYQGKYIKLVEVEVAIPGGKKVTRGIVRHPGAVVVVPVTNDGALLLVRQYRFALDDTILEFPAGTLEHGEDPLECAKREICEEVLHSAESWRSLGILYPAPGFCDEKQYLYLAKDLTPKSLERDEDEVMDVVKMSLSDVEQAIKDDIISDGKTLAAFAKARALALI